MKKETQIIKKTESTKLNIKTLYKKIKFYIAKSKPGIKFLKTYLLVNSAIKLAWDIFIIFTFSNTGMIYIMRY